MRIDLLDHGYLELVEHWGSDQRIIEAARMSTGKGFLGWGSTWVCARCGDDFDCWKHGGPCPKCGEGSTSVPGKPGDEKLLRYLYEHKHSTPFEMAGLIVEVQAPIFVFREWHRHRTQSYNEMSARYTPLPNLNYVATVERHMLGGGHLTKQAGTIPGAEQLTPEIAEQLMEKEREFNAAAEEFYQQKLRLGVAKELARTHLGFSRYSRMRASANLRNWLAFLTLRMAPQAQWEIREYANAVGAIVADKFPRTWELFSEAA